MIVDVAIPFRVSGSFHYEAPPDIAPKIQVGSVIEVPFRNQSTFAYVIGLPESTSLDPSRIKSVAGIMSNAPLFDSDMLTFLKWVSEYYCHPLGEVISAAIPRQSWEPHKNRILKKRKQEPLSILAGAIPDALTVEQLNAIRMILDPEDKRPLLLHGVTGSGKTEVYIQCLKHWIDRKSTRLNSSH